MSGPVPVALAAGGVVALVAAAVGVFTVIRGQSFAGHALGDLGTLGGSAAFLAGVNPMVGYLAVGAVVAGSMDLLGVQRQRSREVATGVVLGAALGASALLLSLATTSTSTTGETVAVLFGSLFSVAPSTLPAMVVVAAIVVAAVAVAYRPLLLSSVHPDLAAARGVPVRRLGVGFLVLVGLSMALAAMVVGTILSPALLVGPAAIALRVTRRPAAAMAVAAGVGVAATWLGVLLAYQSASWPPGGRGWPVSFFVVALVLFGYVVTDVATAHRRRPETLARPGDAGPGAEPHCEPELPAGRG